MPVKTGFFVSCFLISCSLCTPFRHSYAYPDEVEGVEEDEDDEEHDFNDDACAEWDLDEVSPLYFTQHVLIMEVHASY